MGFNKPEIGKKSLELHNTVTVSRHLAYRSPIDCNYRHNPNKRINDNNKGINLIQINPIINNNKNNGQYLKATIA